MVKMLVFQCEVHDMIEANSTFCKQEVDWTRVTSLQRWMICRYFWLTISESWQKVEKLTKSLKENICKNEDFEIFWLVTSNMLRRKQERWQRPLRKTYVKMKIWKYFRWECSKIDEKAKTLKKSWLSPLRKTYVKLKIWISFCWEWSESWRKDRMLQKIWSSLLRKTYVKMKILIYFRW